MRKGIRWLAVTALAALGTLGGGLALSAAPAGAFSGYAFIPPAFGSFTYATGVGVDPANGNVYVANGGGAEVVDVFGAEGGSPAGSGPPTLTGAKTPAGAFEFGSEPTGVSVDSSGNVYVTDVKHNVVDKFKLNGAHEYEYVSQLTGFGEPLGVAVDSLGNVYVANYSGEAVEEFTSAGVKIEAFKSPHIAHPQGVAIDSTGDIYVQAYSSHNLEELKRSSPTSTTVLSESEIAPGGVTGITFNRATEDLFADFGSHIVEYNSEGNVVGSPIGEGTLGESLGLAANEKTANEVDVSDNSTHAADVFGLVELPTAITEAATNKLSSSATLNGKINTEGIKAEQIEFEYGLTTAYGTKIKAEPEEIAVGEGLVKKDVSGLEPNQAYHFRVVAHNAGVASPGKDETFTTAAAGSAVTESPASNVSRTGALLEGTVNPENSETTYHFVYGTSESYGSSTPTITLPAGLEAKATGPQVLSELQPGTTYHYALVATNPAGTTTGLDETFTTSPPTPPTAVVLGAVGITQSTATLIGGLDPEELQTAYAFEIAGPPGTNGYEFSPVTHASANGGPQPISTELAYLAPATTYHYRIVAVNQDGSATSSEGVFTTGSYPAPPAETFQVFPDLSKFVEPEEKPPLTCKKGYVVKNGKCVKKKKKATGHHHAKKPKKKKKK